MWHNLRVPVGSTEDLASDRRNQEACTHALNRRAVEESAAPSTICDKPSPARAVGLSGPAGRPKTGRGVREYDGSHCKQIGCCPDWGRRLRLRLKKEVRRSSKFVGRRDAH